MIEDNGYCAKSLLDSDSRPGEWRKDTEGYQRMVKISKNVGSNNYTKDAKTVRDNFKHYFMSESGAAEWQINYIHRNIYNFDEEYLSRPY